MKTIQLTQGKVALVDDEDFEQLNEYKWCAVKSENTWYAIRNKLVSETRDNGTIRMHREVLGLLRRDKIEVDHRNHNGLDNQKQNLRICTHAENHHNQIKAKKGRSIYKGVSVDNRYKTWVSRIRINNTPIYLGSFRSEIEAAKAYDRKAVEIFGKFAYLNFKELCNE